MESTVPLPSASHSSAVTRRPCPASGSEKSACNVKGSPTNPSAKPALGAHSPATSKQGSHHCIEASGPDVSKLHGPRQARWPCASQTE